MTVVFPSAGGRGAEPRPGAQLFRRQRQAAAPRHTGGRRRVPSHARMHTRTRMRNNRLYLYIAVCYNRICACEIGRDCFGTIDVDTSYGYKKRECRECKISYLFILHRQTHCTQYICHSMYLHILCPIGCAGQFAYLLH